MTCVTLGAIHCVGVDTQPSGFKVVAGFAFGYLARIAGCPFTRSPANDSSLSSILVRHMFEGVEAFGGTQRVQRGEIGTAPLNVAVSFSIDVIVMPECKLVIELDSLYTP